MVGIHPLALCLIRLHLLNREVSKHLSMQMCKAKWDIISFCYCLTVKGSKWASRWTASCQLSSLRCLLCEGIAESKPPHSSGSSNMNILGAVRFLLWVMAGNKNFRLQVLWQICNKLPRLKLHVALVPTPWSRVRMWLRCLPGMHRALGSIPSTTQTELGGANLSSQPLGVEVEGPGVQGRMAT